MYYPFPFKTQQGDMVLVPMLGSSLSLGAIPASTPAIIVIPKKSAPEPRDARTGGR